MGLSVKVALTDHLEDAAQGFVFQKDSAQNRHLSFEALGRKALSQEVHNLCFLPSGE